MLPIHRGYLTHVNLYSRDDRDAALAFGPALSVPASWQKPTQEIVMTAATIPGLDTAPTKHKGLLAWVQEVAELTQPDRVMFADGSDEEFERLSAHLVEAGTFKRLNPEKQPEFIPGVVGPV